MDFTGITDTSYRWPREQVADVIAGAIRSGELAPGARLPSWQRIADEAQVSKHTVAGAVEILRRKGLIVTIPDRGTFVSDPLPPG
jgi:DNA-binding GntR family transcriptional regulator